jgi:uncharacterized membrane protein
MFGLGIWEWIIILIIFSLIQIIVFFIIVGYAIYKKLRGATIEEIEMAKRINRGQGNVSQSAHQTNKDTEDTKIQPLIIITTIIYALQAAPIIFFGITYIIAVIINYVKKDDVKGTWLESHFRWQRNTFWYSLLWAIIVFILAIGISITGAFLNIVALERGLAIFVVFIFIADGIWVIYRIVKGWLNLSDKKKMYA